MFDYRINRSVYWLWLAGAAALYVVGSLITYYLSIYAFVLTILFVPRLHDLGRSGYYAALPALIGTGCLVPAFAFDNPDIFRYISATSITIFALILGILPGQSAMNRWGEKPKAWLGGSVRRQAADQ